MRQELDDLLCLQYPLIFAQRSMKDSGMSQGFTCGDGWFALIDALCECLQFDIDHTVDLRWLPSRSKKNSGHFVSMSGRAANVSAA